MSAAEAARTKFGDRANHLLPLTLNADTGAGTGDKVTSLDCGLCIQLSRETRPTTPSLHPHQHQHSRQVVCPHKYPSHGWMLPVAKKARPPLQKNPLLQKGIRREMMMMSTEGLKTPGSPSCLPIGSIAVMNPMPPPTSFGHLPSF